MWPCIVTNFFVIKPTRCANFTNLFCHETVHVSGSSSVHHQEFIHCALSNGICHTGLMTAFKQEHMLLLESCLQTCVTYKYTGAECKVEDSRWWAEELLETYRASWQKKFGTLARLLVLLQSDLLASRLLPLLPLGKNPSAQWKRGWVDPTARKICCLCWDSNTDSPASSLGDVQNTASRVQNNYKFSKQMKRI